MDCKFFPAEHDGYQHCGEHGADRHPGAPSWTPCPASPVVAAEDTTPDTHTQDGA